MPLSAAGEAQLTGSTFMVLLVLKLGQGPFLGYLLILCQRNTWKDSATQGKWRQHQPPGPHLGWRASLGCSCPGQTAGISWRPGQGPPAALLRVVVSKLLISGTHHRPPSLQRAAPACICPALGTGGTTGNRPGAANPFPWRDSAP